MPYAFEFKIKAKKNQYAVIHEAIRIGQFIRNKCIRLWMDGKGNWKSKII